MSFKVIPTLAAAAMAVVLAPATTAMAFGGLAQESGRAGCVSSSKKQSAACTKARVLTQANDVAISPDGGNAYVVGYGSSSVSIFARNPQTGALTQERGKAGCIADGAADGCQRGRALEDPRGVAVSPDGRNVYVASEDSRSVSIFDRNPQTGALTQERGKAGCISADPTERSCQRSRSLRAGAGVTVSPDGTSVYVASLTLSRARQGTVSIFDRDRSSGALTQRTGSAGCISPDGSGGGCLKDPAIQSPFQVAVSPDGRSFYVSNYFSNAIAVFARDPGSGNITQQSSAFACRTGGQAGCETKTKTFGAIGELVISPDGKNVYLTAIDGLVGIFDRDAATGALTQKAGAAGCIAERSHGACGQGRQLGEPEGIAISPDGKSLYVSSYTTARVLTFDRDPVSGGLSQQSGSAGCFSLDGSHGSCGKGKAFGGSSSVEVSPDGNNVYVVSAASSSVAVFARDTEG